MKAIHLRGHRFVLSALAAAVVSACGGGGDGSQGSPADSVPPTSPTTPAITGKAIDGYLVGAAVCLDLNSNNACDANEPSAITDADGNFSLPYSGDASGKRLLVQVTPSTRDLARPAGFQFPASFTLSNVATGSAAQVVTPLTTMVAAQIEAGFTQAEAIAAIQALLGSKVDPMANYVANGDTATATAASQIVDKVTAFASAGKADPATIRHVLNAILAKGDIASITQTDVDAQASKPVYVQANAAEVLANPVYSLVDADNLGNLDGATQAIQQIANGMLQTTYQQRQADGTTWTTLPTNAPVSFMDPRAQFVMQADGTWSDMLTPDQWHAPQPLSAAGVTLSGTDPVTGIGFTLEERRVDLSHQPMTMAIADIQFGPNVSLYPALNKSFPAGTTGYVGIQSYAGDRIVLPLGLSGQCDFPYLKDGACPTGPAWMPGTSLNLPPYDPSRPRYDPNQPLNDAKLPSPLTSVQQLVGRTLIEPVITSAEVQISPDGKAQLTVDEGTPKVVNATWTVYARNPNVMVFDMSRADATTLADLGYNAWTLSQGAKLVMALRGGQLQSGLLFPAGYAQRTVQFANALPSQLLTPVDLNRLLSKRSRQPK
ncbi:hypothetical protein ACKI2N_032680 [Cupriavidus sp. 30B13]|uniref:hypothetical protein n=1 Tax=Cupriavidus sp. 30B13 TaxID=3384241 RepID=UPI003B9003A6